MLGTKRDASFNKVLDQQFQGNKLKSVSFYKCFIVKLCLTF